MIWEYEKRQMRREWAWRLKRGGDARVQGCKAILVLQLVDLGVAGALGYGRIQPAGISREWLCSLLLSWRRKIGR